MAAPLTFFEGVIYCGVNNVNIFDGQTAAQWLATDLFSDYFSTFVNKYFEVIDATFKSYPYLTTTQGHIRLLTGVKENINAFFQFLRDKILLGGNPADTLFVARYAQKYTRKYKIYEKFMSDSKTVSEAGNPSAFASNTKWMYWGPTLVN